MKLLIVESPGKIKKIQSILGNDWAVSASVGHFRDLPQKEMGVQPPNFIPQYEVTKEAVINKLQKLVAKSDEVYLATDPDREGEAIAWHLEDALGLQNPKRVTYTSITQKDVLEGIANARTIDMKLVKAQEARRVLDRLCGYLVASPLSNIAGARLSAGRVQSPAVRLVVERERAIRSFTSTTHYGVELLFDNAFKIQWKTESFRGEQEYILDKELAEQIASLRHVKVTDFKEEEKRKAPSAPFTTSSLQQTASNMLKFAPKQTMELAQKLYEGGHITYMRTDSPNLSQEAVAEVRAYCEKQGMHCSQNIRTWKSKKSAQEAHEAIRPTHIEAINMGNNIEEQALYELIRLRTLASQLEDAVYKTQSVLLESELDSKPVFFEARGSKLVYHGWKEIFQEDANLADSDEQEEETSTIPSLEVGAMLTATSGTVLTKKTQAPQRLTLATLVRELEKRGIGRPATYASILDNIMDKGYIAEEKRKLHATPLGEKLIDALIGSFQFIEFDFTKNLEDELDDIATGKSDYLSLVSKNYDLLMSEIKAMNKAKGTPCPACGETLIHIKTRMYDFFACDACKEKYSNVNGKPTKQKKQFPLSGFKCELCNSRLKYITGSKNGKKYTFYACSNEDCNQKYNSQKGQPVMVQPKKEAKKSEFLCPKCNSPLLEKPTKNGGIYFSCSGYPTCEERFWADEKKQPRFKGAKA